jgi:hypothetical protein
VSAGEFDSSMATRDRIQERLDELCSPSQDLHQQRATPVTLDFNLITYLATLQNNQQALKIAVSGTTIM